MEESALARGFEEPARDSSDSLDLMYKVDGEPNEFDVFELAQVLESFGNLLKEGYRISHPAAGELTVKVKPFQAGSFLMPMGLSVKDTTAVGMLFAAQHYQELLKYARETLEYLGLIEKAGKSFTSLIDLLRRLKKGRPEKVEKKGPDEYDFHSGDGAVIPVNSTINALYNSPVINKNIYNVIIPANHENVSDILTYLKHDQMRTRVRIGKEDAAAIRAYSNPFPEPVDAEVYEDTPIRVLYPKSGNYGQTKGTWQFKVAGQKGSIKAKILDEKFLARYATGYIRFH